MRKLAVSGAVTALALGTVAAPGERRRVTIEIATPPGDFEYCLAPDSRSGAWYSFEQY